MVAKALMDLLSSKSEEGTAVSIEQWKAPEAVSAGTPAEPLPRFLLLFHA